MAEQLISTSSGSIEVLTSGGDGPLVFLLHGNSSSAATFAGTLASRVGRRFRLVSISLPGHGESSSARAPLSEYAVPALAKLVPEIIARFGAERYALVGHSLGGHVFSEALPELPGAAGLVLISAPPLSMSRLSRAFAPDPVDGALFNAELSDDEVDTLASALLAGAGRDADIAALLRRDIRRADPAFRPALGRSIMTGQLDDEVAILAKTRVPVALVFGTADVFLRRSYYDEVELGSTLGEGRFAFDGAGHSPHLEVPVEFQTLLDRLLSEALDVR